jgi:multidrug transporter EmrE-like cation transporter
VKIYWTNPLWATGLFAVYVATSCFGLYLIKVAEDWRTPTFLGGFVLYGMGALIWMAILRITPLSYAFPIAAGLLMIGTVLTGVFLLDEAVSLVHVAGAVLILFGIVLVAFSR